MGGAGNDFINAGNDNDVLLGGTGNDGLLGGNGDDVMFGGEGNDTLVGGDGIDTAYFTGMFENYKMLFLSNGYIRVIDNREGSPDGTDHVRKRDCEYLEFSDGVYNVNEENFVKNQHRYKMLIETLLPIEEAGILDLKIEKYENNTFTILSGNSKIGEIIQENDGWTFKGDEKLLPTSKGQSDFNINFPETMDIENMVPNVEAGKLQLKIDKYSEDEFIFLANDVTVGKITNTNDEWAFSGISKTVSAKDGEADYKVTFSEFNLEGYLIDGEMIANYSFDGNAAVDKIKNHNGRLWC